MRSSLYNSRVMRLYLSAILFGFFSVCGFSAHASGSCIAGLPCVTPAYSGEDPTANPNYKKTGGDNACDADFMNQIYARAIQESDRDVLIAGQNIRKPDSVLELGCFQTLAGMAASGYDKFFTADPKTLLAIPSVGPVRDSVFVPYDKYLSQNFPQALLGYPDDMTMPEAGTTCDQIAAVSYLARCANFDTVGPQFVNFEDLVNLDTRITLAGQSCSAPPWTQDRLDLAENKGMKYSTIGVFADYKDLVDGQSCSTVKPIDTGLSYKRSTGRVSWTDLGAYIFGGPKVVKHKICVNPACYYNHNAEKCVSRF